MSDISVECTPADAGWRCRVQVSEGDSATEHEVSVERAELERLAPGAADPHQLVHESFVYMLEREPKEAILRRFEIGVIGRYFSSYPADIGRRLSG